MKQKQTIIIGALIVLLLLAGGVAVLQSKRSAPLPPSGTETQTASLTPSAKTGTAFTSIQEALSGSLSLECSFTDEQNRQTHSFIKNGAVRADITGSSAQESGSMVLKDKKMYFWNSTKQGFMMAIPEITPGMPNTKMPTRQLSQEQEMMQNLEKYKEHCQPTPVADSQFTIPTDITFTDMAKMMQGVPTGMMQRPPMNQEQIDTMMKTYKTGPENGQ